MNKSLLIYLGGDQVYIYTDTEVIQITKNGLEEEMSRVLHEQYRSGVRKIRTIQGPGSFLYIRVGSLLLNILQSMAADHMILYSIAKDSLYQRLYDEGYTPRYTLMFIGQKKNARRCDHKISTKKTIRMIDTPDFCDHYMVDNVDNQDNKGIKIQYAKKPYPCVVWKGKEIDITDAPWILNDNILPYYGVNPTIH